MTYRLGVDVGGTFTDVLLIDEVSGRTFREKTPSTPQDQSIGVLRGMRAACAAAGIDPREVRSVLHGTTVATNAILEGKGARVGLVTTSGFRQVLQIARSYVPGGLAGWIIWPKPEPLAALEDTVEVAERVDAEGRIVRELDEDDARRQLRTLKEQGVESVSVSLLHSYANPRHELRIAELAAEELPGVQVSLSHAVLPEMREYERTITTVANSYVQPRVATYVDHLHRQLSSAGADGPLYILRSDGGLVTAEAAEHHPVSLLMSGPAGGVTGAVRIAEELGIGDFLTFDMGGTSTDVALVQGLTPRVGRDTKVGDLAVRATSIDVRTVGAGGGSIAHVPALTQALRVGPQSAGAVPGPAAYGGGGTEPTVTDANTVLGYLPAELAGGELSLDRTAAVAAVQRIADATGLDSVQAAAEGIVDIVNENMLGALRLVSVQQGFDPRDFALIAYGGAGPLHANALGILTGAWPVVIPPSPGVLCALGDATTGLRHEVAKTVVRPFASLDDDALRAMVDALVDEVGHVLTDQGVDTPDQALTYGADIRYHGQGFEIAVDIDAASLATGQALDRLRADFDAEHERLFSFLLDTEHELVSVRVTGSGPRASVTDPELPEGGPDAADARVDEQLIWVNGRQVEAGIYRRAALKSGNVIPGPAVVVEMDSTTLILPEHAATVHSSGSLLIRPAAPAAAQ